MKYRRRNRTRKGGCGGDAGAGGGGVGCLVGGRTRARRGGSGLFFKDVYYPPTPLPSPLVGTPWKGDLADWPGVNGIGGDKNYYSLNTHQVDPQTEGVSLYSGGPASQYRGGRRHRRPTRRRRRRRGGSGLQDLQNVGRYGIYQAQSLLHTFRGEPSPVNPLPFAHQFPSSVR